MLARPRPDRLTLLWRFVRRERLHRLVVALVVLFALSGFALRVLEPDTSLGNWFWWSVVTMTNMGDRYGLRRRASIIFLEHTEVMTDLEGKLGDQLVLVSPREA